MTSAPPVPIWQWPPPDPQAEALGHTLGVSPILATLLRQRGFTDEAAARAFLDPKLQALGDPFLITDLRVAAERLLHAIAQSESIILYSDYDVDGVTSSALMLRALRKLGAQKIRSFLPHRMDEGYGLTRDGLERCLQEHGGAPGVLVALDCGTNSPDEIAWLQAQGTSVIVVDHHTLGDRLPECAAVVNPHRDGARTYFATVGLAFKLCHGLLKLLPEGERVFDLRNYLDLAATGTIADIVPLVEENRILVHHGLRVLEQTQNAGLRALKEITGMKGAATPYDIGFKIGPRLNAMGRLGDALESLQLLTTDDAQEAERLAQALDLRNRERQETERGVLEEAKARLEAEFDPERSRAIVVGGRGWHPGVVGIVASRLQKLHYRPAIIIGFDDAGIGKGSARSIAGCHIADALRACEEHLERCGGHAMAAGLTIQEEKLPAFCSALEAWLAENVPADAWQPRLAIDALIDPQAITVGLWEELQKLAPFGQGNPEPVLAVGPVMFDRLPSAFGKEAQHLKMTIRTGAGRTEAVAFGQAHWLANTPSLPLFLGGNLRWDDYRDTIQLRLMDWKSAD